MLPVTLKNTIFLSCVTGLAEIYVYRRTIAMLESNATKVYLALGIGNGRSVKSLYDLD